MRPKIPEGDAVRRVRALSFLAGKGKAAYIRRWTGKTVAALVEKNSPAGVNTIAGMTDNYLRVVLPAPGGQGPPPSPFRCRICGPWNGPGEDIDISGELVV
jgi:tRNA A37 methylthiotransferase MiaB